MAEPNPEDTARVEREDVRKEAERAAMEAAVEAAGPTTEHPSLTSYQMKPRKGTRAARVVK